MTLHDIYESNFVRLRYNPDTDIVLVDRWDDDYGTWHADLEIPAREIRRVISL